MLKEQGIRRFKVIKLLTIRAFENCDWVRFDKLKKRENLFIYHQIKHK